ncbi:MAG: hypothetical protein AAB338_02880 [Patescibacteria group bacterium]
MDVEKIVREAKKFMETSGDHKSWATEREMIALIAAGAQVIKDVRESNTYILEVIYKGIWFIHVSRNPFIPTVPINSTIH